VQAAYRLRHLADGQTLRLFIAMDWESDVPVLDMLLANEYAHNQSAARLLAEQVAHAAKPKRNRGDFSRRVTCYDPGRAQLAQLAQKQQEQTEQAEQETTQETTATKEREHVLSGCYKMIDAPYARATLDNAAKTDIAASLGVLGISISPFLAFYADGKTNENIRRRAFAIIISKARTEHFLVKELLEGFLASAFLINKTQRDFYIT
jgi:hypothetical protein